MTAVVVQLPEDTNSFVEQQVAAGQFATPGEFILSLVEEARRRSAIERVDALLLEGLASGAGEAATPEWWAKTRQEWRQGRPGSAAP